MIVCVVIHAFVAAVSFMLVSAPSNHFFNIRSQFHLPLWEQHAIYVNCLPKMFCRLKCFLTSKTLRQRLMAQTMEKLNRSNTARSRVDNFRPNPS